MDLPDVRTVASGAVLHRLRERLLESARVPSFTTSTQELYAPAFDHAVMVNAKIAIHFHAFWLIVFCALVPILALALVAFMFVSGIQPRHRVAEA
jgi:hypothetical protein